ncbi:UPF0280 family protein [Denitrobaculum tricleocarpae]|uniref:UPF0280 family protein n=1 Tax=Denitrobaculum tricleocarpae TaxID=2591009 RepID=A0A545T7Z6_9PROT|nr:UPF0280 family protein [Denitrobaculum tricleocarpae]TQV73356.1 UPF0280 family protein [Denitrobaculum tricleocarpae]
MSWASPQSAILSDGRLHLQQGPIDLIIEAVADQDQRALAFVAAQRRFLMVLTELVEELTALRQPVTTTGEAFRGKIARRMAQATWPLADRHFITPMAAVAGAVADDILYAMTHGAQLEKAYVNNGGDIALYLAPGQSFTTGLVADPRRPQLDGRFTVNAGEPVRGIATSGRHGRSLSLGIADSVTVLASSAAAADAAATMIANAVDLPGHAAIERQAACELDPDSDLGAREVTVELGFLNPQEVSHALANGLAEAQRLRDARLIHAAVLTLENQIEVCNKAFPLILETPKTERAAHA